MYKCVFSGWVHAYQTFGCIALVSVIVNLVLMILYMFVWKENGLLRKAIILSAFASGIVTLSVCLSLCLSLSVCLSLSLSLSLSIIDS